MQRNSTRIIAPCVIVIAPLALLLGGCVTGNERDSLGNFTTGNSVKLHEYTGMGEPPPMQSDGVSTPTLSRQSWRVTPVLVPVDGLASHPTYARTHLYTRATSRQKNQQPTALTALELDGDTGWTQVHEAAVSAPLALWDGVRVVAWDMWVEGFWDASIRPTPQPYARADPVTSRLLPLAPIPSLSEHYAPKTPYFSTLSPPANITPTFPASPPPITPAPSTIPPSDSADPASGSLPAAIGQSQVGTAPNVAGTAPPANTPTPPPVSPPKPEKFDDPAKPS